MNTCTRHRLLPKHVRFQFIKELCHAMNGKLSVNPAVNGYLLRIREGEGTERRGMGYAFHQLCQRYNRTLTSTAPTVIRLWKTFTLKLSCACPCLKFYRSHWFPIYPQFSAIILLASLPSLWSNSLTFRLLVSLAILFGCHLSSTSSCSILNCLCHSWTHVQGTDYFPNMFVSNSSKNLEDSCLWHTVVYLKVRTL